MPTYVPPHPKSLDHDNCKVHKMGPRYNINNCWVQYVVFDWSWTSFWCANVTECCDWEAEGLGVIFPRIGRSHLLVAVRELTWQEADTVRSRTVAGYFENLGMGKV